MAKRKRDNGPWPADDEHPRLARKAYDKRLAEQQYRMRAIALAYHRHRLSGVVVIEGTDTAGKGGAIRRLTAELDPRHYHVWPIGVPSQEELRHHYLRRFWLRLPSRGLIGIFDRSWYGRVLVERVDRLATAAEWRRAYGEIRDFERSLLDGGTRLVKLYLHVSEAEQRRRLAERVKAPEKRWKVSAADFRSHLQREAYLTAAAEMVERTSTEAAPWHVVAGDDKRHARIAVLEAVTETLARDVDLTPAALDAETARLAREVLDLRV